MSWYAVAYSLQRAVSQVMNTTHAVQHIVSARIACSESVALEYELVRELWYILLRCTYIRFNHLGTAACLFCGACERAQYAGINHADNCRGATITEVEQLLTY